MNWRKFTLIACLSGLFITLPIWVANISVSKLAQPKPPLNQFSVEQIQQQAQAITVKVMSSDVLGSGIILQRQGSVYTVLTNAHVLRAGNPPYRIQTSDRHIWQNVETNASTSLHKNDLAILQFRSTGKVYLVASLGSSPVVGMEVFAGGFPTTEEVSGEKGFVFNTGKVSLVLPKALEGGYQVGYTNNIQKGMSGGPLLNRQGKVVGVNGMHANPIWDAPSVFADGSEAAPALHQKITRLSWAVPIDTVRTLLPRSPRSQVPPGNALQEALPPPTPKKQTIQN
ncbi:S1 family peptidase [Iningainema tapete]|uniref:Trypsin-like peptidase domain-containing protein n=1 Tax=Iningainema tapete BLCC-T55 TaxID=2748662 RepID=A0A8J6XFL7_9CYAN|nr:serine protease [Iningainema tapete]MBD2775760.1 trypsin-like peptidase domain-containing protein [Iningainema tapete BLCC-T55]